MITILALVESQLDKTIAMVARAFGKTDTASIRKDFTLTFSDYPFKPVTFVALSSDVVVGAIQIWEICIAHDLFGIASLAVDPAWQRQGIATKLIIHAEEHIRSVCLQNKPGTIILTNGVSFDHARDDFYTVRGYQTGPSDHRGQKFMMKFVNIN